MTEPTLSAGSSDIVTVCAWCLKAGEITAPKGVCLSHGVCARHADAMRAELAALLAAR